MAANSGKEIGVNLRPRRQRRMKYLPRFHFHGTTVAKGAKPQPFLVFVLKLPDDYTRHSPMISLLSP